MAENSYKKPQKKKKEKIKKSGAHLNFLKDPRLHLAFGLFLLVLSGCLFLAFVSYLFTGKADQSVVQAWWGEASLIESGQEAQNWLGMLGASLSYLFIFRWFGVASFLFIPIFAFAGIKIVFKKEVDLLVPFTKASIFGLFWISMALGYIVLISETRLELEYLCGGIGYTIAEFSNSLAGWGTLLFLVLILAVFVIYFFDIKSLVGVQKSSGFEEEKEDYEPIVETDIASGYSAEAESMKETFDVTESNSDEISVESPETSLTLEGSEEALPSIQVDSSEIELANEKTVVEVDKVNVEEGPAFSVEEVEEEQLSGSLEVKEEEDLGLVVEPEAQDGEDEAEVNENYDPKLDLPHYKYPGLDLLNAHEGNKVQVTREELEANKDNIVNTLGNYKIGISSIKATIGPTVTLYEIVPEAGVKISKIKNLEDDIALSLAALGIRIIAPIPGRGTIGIEVPNKNREMVAFRSVVATDKFMKSDKELPIVLGKTISNETFVIDLAKMPHILMAGATGQGKSVGINIILSSLLFKKHPSQLKFVLVDPKKVELSIYSHIEKHFLAMLPDGEEAIITDTKKVIHTLNSLCIEMDQRYDLLKSAGCRNLKEYNKKFVERKLNPNKGHRFMPYIVLVIDELADLMMTAGKEVETPIARLAQLARAIGIHLVVATQRPSVNVITGIIKANFPARVSFKVTSKVDSRTILDTGGADQLVGMGDFLFSQGSELTRVQCAFVDTPEVDEIVKFIGDQPAYDTAFMLPEYVDESAEGLSDVDLSDRDAMFEEAARTIVAHQQGSTSLLQRKLKLGYNRAGRIVDQLEAAGIVGPFEGSKAREVYVKDEFALEQLLKELNGIQKEDMR